MRNSTGRSSWQLKQFVPEVEEEVIKPPPMAVPEVLFSFEMPSDDEDLPSFAIRYGVYMLVDY